MTEGVLDGGGEGGWNGIDHDGGGICGPSANTYIGSGKYLI
jgi:hypothetical protein